MEYIKLNKKYNMLSSFTYKHTLKSCGFYYPII